MLQIGETFRDLVGDFYTKRSPDKAKSGAISQARSLGYMVTLGQQLRRRGHCLANWCVQGINLRVRDKRVYDVALKDATRSEKREWSWVSSAFGWYQPIPERYFVGVRSTWGG